VAKIVDHNVEYGEEGVHIEHEELVPFPWGLVSKPTLIGGHLPLKFRSNNSHQAFKNGAHFSLTQGTQSLGLKVAGVAVPVEVAPNTEIRLPGVGYGIVNEQKLPAAGSTARTHVNGLHVFVTKNNTLGVPVGIQIIVAHAASTAVRF
jgi:hypothetical protein